MSNEMAENARVAGEESPRANPPAHAEKPVRADIALVQRGLSESREKAQALIMAGQVYVGENKVEKASRLVREEEPLLVRGKAHPYVGRGGLKLEKALDVFHADVRGCVAMDIGAATGGFTDVLLRGGARRVYAIDVGYGQFDYALRTRPEVVVMERTNARYLTREQFPEQPTVTVMDVSFISIKLILPVAAAIMDGKGVFYALVKPQFEAGRERVGKKGVVRDAETHRDVIASVAAFAPTFGYALTALDFSPITGPEGNIEFLAKLEPQAAGQATVTEGDIARVVAAAHAAHAK